MARDISLTKMALSLKSMSKERIIPRTERIQLWRHLFEFLRTLSPSTGILPRRLNSSNHPIQSCSLVEVSH